MSQKVFKNGIDAANSMTKPVTVRADQVKDKFFGVPAGSEEADDVLFAIQAYYGNPKIDYEEAAGRFSDDEVKEAVDYIKKKGYNKFTYFSGDPYGEGDRQ